MQLDVRKSLGGGGWHRFLTESGCYCEWPDYVSVRNALKTVNAVNIPMTQYIEFENEEDATAFVLKWKHYDAGN